MRPDYHGIKFYSVSDMSLGYNYEKSKIVLDSFDDSKHYDDINEIIELDNICQIFYSGGIKKEFVDKYAETVRK